MLSTVETKMDDLTEIEYITLKSKDDRRFQIDKRAAVKSSQFIEGLLESDTTVTEIDLDYSSEFVEMFVKFANEYLDKDFVQPTMPLKSSKFDECVSKFDNELVNYYAVEDKIDNSEKFANVMKFANYLGANGLIHLAGAKIANIFRGSTADEILLATKRMN